MTYITRDIIWNGRRAVTATRAGEPSEYNRIFGGNRSSLKFGDWHLTCKSMVKHDFRCEVVTKDIRHILSCESNYVMTSHGVHFTTDFLYNNDWICGGGIFDDSTPNPQLGCCFSLATFAIQYKGHMLPHTYQVMQLGLFLLLFDPDKPMHLQGIAIGELDEADDSSYLLSKILWASDPDLVRSYFLYHDEKD